MKFKYNYEIYIYIILSYRKTFTDMEKCVRYTVRI